MPEWFYVLASLVVVYCTGVGVCLAVNASGKYSDDVVLPVAYLWPVTIWGVLGYFVFLRLTRPRVPTAVARERSK